MKPQVEGERYICNEISAGILLTCPDEISILLVQFLDLLVELQVLERQSYGMELGHLCHERSREVLSSVQKHPVHKDTDHQRGIEDDGRHESLVSCIRDLLALKQVE